MVVSISRGARSLYSRATNWLFFPNEVNRLPRDGAGQRDDFVAQPGAAAVGNESGDITRL